MGCCPTKDKFYEQKIKIEEILRNVTDLNRSILYYVSQRNLIDARSIPPKISNSIKNLSKEIQILEEIFAEQKKSMNISIEPASQMLKKEAELQALKEVCLAKCLTFNNENYSSFIDSMVDFIK